MNAIILAAGYGRRLGKITYSKPKCLIKIYNDPILIRWIKILIKIGIKNILINTHYKNNLVKKVIQDLKNYNIKLSYEKKLLGTAGTLIKNLDFFENKDGLILSADNFLEENSLKNFRKFHKRNKKLISLYGFKTKDVKNSGIFEFYNNGTIKCFHEKKNLKANISYYANGSIFIFKNDFLQKIKKKKYKDISRDIIPKNLDNISVFKSRSKIIDIGIMKNYKYLLGKKIINE